jgi:NADPH-dependent 2,4-dienoyl-CoA reductase/sulfur reductase-like enzyme
VVTDSAVNVLTVLTMFHQRQVIHSLINTITCRHLLNASHNTAVGSRYQTTASFPYEAEDNSVGHGAPMSLPKEAKVVIWGGGVMGAAVAYHLAELGWGPQTVLIEKGR